MRCRSVAAPYPHMYPHPPGRNGHGIRLLGWLLSRLAVFMGVIRPRTVAVASALPPSIRDLPLADDLLVGGTLLMDDGGSGATGMSPLSSLIEYIEPLAVLVAANEAMALAGDASRPRDSRHGRSGAATVVTIVAVGAVLATAAYLRWKRREQVVSEPRWLVAPFAPFAHTPPTSEPRPEAEPVAAPSSMSVEPPAPAVIEPAPSVDRAASPQMAVVADVFTPPLEGAPPAIEPVAPAPPAVEPAASERQLAASEPLPAAPAAESMPIAAASTPPTEVPPAAHVATDATISRISPLAQARNTTVGVAASTGEPAPVAPLDTEPTRRSSLGAPSSPPSSAAPRFAVPGDRAALPGRGTRIPEVVPRPGMTVGAHVAMLNVSPPSSRGPGRHPFKVETGVRIPLGVPRWLQPRSMCVGRGCALWAVASPRPHLRERTTAT